LIGSFKDRKTKAVFEGLPVRQWRGIHAAAKRKLDQLASAKTLDDMRSLRATASKRLRAIERANTACELTISSACASAGRVALLTTWRLSTITEGGMAMSFNRPKEGWNIRRVTTHPGAMLREEFMKPMGLSANHLAMDLHVPVTRINEIIRQRRRVTADTALRLARYFGTSPEFWLNLQQLHDLTLARQKSLRNIERDVRPATAA
jgi:antitoxin HigA-1